MSKLRQKIEESYKKALKSKEELKVKTLRLIKSAIKNKDISIKSQGKKDISSDEIFLIPNDTTFTFGLSKHLLIAEA